MNKSENRSWGLTGLLAVVLWIVGLTLLTHNGPADHATGSEILAWYRSDTNTILLGGWLFMLGCLSFVTFLSGLRVRLADVLGASSPLPGLALAGAAIAGVCGMLTAAVDVGGAIDKSDIGPSTAAAFHHFLDVFFVSAELATILPVGVVAIAAWRTRVLPRWWAAFSALVAVVLVIGPIGWLGLIFGVPVWMIGTSLFVLLRSPERVRGTAAATA
ncbi:MAG TPA: hypothetical protein VGH26_10640 [Gaiellaceae bacterium]|jgi:hypothetical protein